MSAPNDQNPANPNYRARLASVRNDLVRIVERVHQAADKLHGNNPPRAGAPTPPTSNNNANIALELDCVQASLSAVENWISNAHNALDRLEDSL